ncbi:PQQ-binding-like beta-propeller repeat protein [Salinigranum marinum]|uniref:outer membrane protein assembly factor BamB family protein n=1 Tax=Salinigranum marinum TaxID=1515595 RepID=UPI002989B523|nr:PQQ-binding-like beta-propeller repeat protein [Salinigranum marinum]
MLRREFLASLGFGSALSKSSPPAAGSDGRQWSMHRGDAGRTNTFPQRNTLGETLAVAWSHEWSRRTVNRPPAPVFDADRVYIAQNAGVLAAVDRTTGESVWSRSDLSGQCHTPVVGDDRIVLPTDDGMVAYDTRGREQWQTDRPAEWDPVLSDGVLYTRTAGIDINDGSVQAEFPADSYVAPTVGDGRIYRGSARVARAYDADSGTVLWENDDLLDEEWVQPATFVFADGRLFIPGVDGLIALDAATGAELWRYTDRFSELYQAPTVVNGTVVQQVAGGPRTAERLVQFDVTDGTVIREFGPSGADGVSITSVGATPGTVLALCGDRIVSFDVHTGETLSSTWLAPVFDWPTRVYKQTFAYDGRRLIVNGEDRTIALEPGPIRERDRVGMGIGVAAGLAVAGVAHWWSDPS